VDIQVPRFEHRSVLNLTVPLERMGLNDLFKSGVADLGGVNGMQDLYLTDLTQVQIY
jgi:serine protease inhibitor